MALSPMMRQYMEIHEQYPDCLLMFRVGDFYELFFEDAKTASRELELTLTGKDCGLEERAPMCGVPFHAVDTYVERLCREGYRVAICEQTEDPATAKGLVKRDVIRVITPGTMTPGTEEKKNHFLLCVYTGKTESGAAWVDVSTGEFYVSEQKTKEIGSEIIRIGAAEVICNSAEEVAPFAPGAGEQNEAWFREGNAAEELKNHFHAGSMTALGLEGHRNAVRAAGALMRYLRETQKNPMTHIARIEWDSGDGVMMLDGATKRNLEICESIRGKGRKGTLLEVLDRTKTAMGSRLMRRWLEEPSTNPEEIAKRHDAVAEMTENSALMENVREALDGVYDMERLMSKVAYGSLNARDCLALGRSLRNAEQIRKKLGDARSEMNREIRDGMDGQNEIAALIEKAIHPDAPVSITEGGIIRDGYDETLDEYRRAQGSGREWILEMEQRERKRTGIKNLRIQYNRVFGYYIEVTKSNLPLVPEEYIRKQTLAGAERFMTPELKEMEMKIIGAQDMSVRLETRLFGEVREKIAEALSGIRKTCEQVKKLDVICALATAAMEQNYVRPEMNTQGLISVREGRHPVVERSLGAGEFVPNDTEMDSDGNRMMIITGPNMAGKSTYMRQVALICLMAQVGSFVPAEEAKLTVCDRIFTRVGAADDLSSGQSTFMMEMSETAYILSHATEKSLIILDEIGRGTSTFDGLAIAWAVVEYILNKEKIGAKTLFATHYHELSELEGHLEGVKNYCVSVRERGEDVVFLRKIVRGGADRSFGVQVVKDGRDSEGGCETGQGNRRETGS